MLLSQSDNPVLIIIDVQNGIDDPYWGDGRNNPDAEQQIASLLAVWRKHGLPTVHVQHCSKNADSPFRPNQSGHEFKDMIAPLASETVIQKGETCAFVGTNLEEYLRSRSYNTLVITGVITNNSVEATARLAGNLGFNTVVVSDATATFAKQDFSGQVHSAETIHNISLANLQGEYASILATKEIINTIERHEESKASL